MTPRALGRLFFAYATLTLMVCVVVHVAASLRDVKDGVVIQSAWKGGQLVARQAGGAPLVAAGTVVGEKIVAEGALLTSIEPLFALSIVAGRDGVEASIDGKTAYVTPDDLSSREAYDKGITIPSLTLSLGTDVQMVLAVLAQRLDVTVPDLRARGTLRRIRTTHVSGATAEPFASTKPGDVTPAMLRASALDAARYLARGVTAEGRFQYMVDAPSGRVLGGYDWPRHAGATYFLAQAAALSGDPLLRAAAVRSGAYLRDKATLDCGGLKCVGAGNQVNVGSSALALIAMKEIASAGLDPGFKQPVVDLARFLRAQQRADGEFKHLYDRVANRAIDIQLMYYSGEATLALARAHELTGDPADLDGARRGLAHIVGPAWSFFGDRYYFGEEHWTCQAVADLWERAPDPEALDFCIRWRAYDANMMYAPGETPFDADGAFGVGPVVTPRLTPVASRSEAGVATLSAMERAGIDEGKRQALSSQLHRSFALLLRDQFRPGPAYLFADPAEVYGAMPGSPVDWQLRIDYAQHAGSAMIRAAALWSSPPKPSH